MPNNPHLRAKRAKTDGPPGPGSPHSEVEAVCRDFSSVSDGLIIVTGVCIELAHGISSIRAHRVFVSLTLPFHDGFSQHSSAISTLTYALS